MSAALPQRKLADQLSTLSQLDKAIAKRIADAEKADANLQKRLELLAKAELSLQGTLEQARQVAAQTVPMLQSLPEIQQTIQAAEKVARDWPARRQQIDQDLADLREYLHRGVEESKDRLSDHAADLVKDLHAAAKVFGKQLSADLEVAEGCAQRVTESIDQRLSSAEQQWDSLETDVQQRLTESARRAQTQLNAVTAPLLARLEQSLQLKQSELLQSVQSLEQQLTQQLADVQSKLISRTAGLERHLGQADTFFQDQCAVLLTSVRKSITDRLVDIEVETRLASRPILEQIESQRDMTQRQIRFALDAAEQVIQARLGEIRRNASETLDVAEQQLLSRLKTLEPQAQNALDAADTRLRERLDRLTLEIRAAIEVAEENLVGEVEQPVRTVEVTLLDAAAERLRRAAPPKSRSIAEDQAA